MNAKPFVLRKLLSLKLSKETSGCSSRLRRLIYLEVRILLPTTYSPDKQTYHCLDLDTTKMKARQFSRSTAPAKKVDNSLWTETPAERQQRLADEVLGKKRRAVNADDSAGPEDTAEARKKQKRDEQIRAGVDEHTVSTSFGSLSITYRDFATEKNTRVRPH